jgi:hypothetical protein
VEAAAERLAPATAAGPIVGVETFTFLADHELAGVPRDADGRAPAIDALVELRRRRLHAATRGG